LGNFNHQNQLGKGVSPILFHHLAVMHALGVPSLLTCPPRSAVAPPHRRAHLKGLLPCASQGDATALVPPGSAAAAAATSPSRAPHGAAAACVPLGSDAATAPTSSSCAPQGGIAARWPQRSADASVYPGSTVARLLLGSAAARATWGWGRNCQRC
jgi:hypothetical protein